MYYRAETGDSQAEAGYLVVFVPLKHSVYGGSSHNILINKHLQQILIVGMCFNRMAVYG